MRALLHDVHLALECEERVLLESWRRLFDIEVRGASALPPGGAADVTLTAETVIDIPQITAVHPSYTDPLSGNGRRVRCYETPAGTVLDLTRPAQIHFEFDAGQAHILLTKNILDTGNLEDVTMIALAPFLRRRGYYMAHAFAVAGDTAVLLSGPSGSGKTTTGLALVSQGARYLANDVALLRGDQGIIRAYLSPGTVNLHPHTLSLLPQYRDRLPTGQTPEGRGKFILSRETLFDDEQLGRPSPISTILFPTIAGQGKPSLYDVPPAVGMARLVEEGVDRWDAETCEEHISFLASLSSQAAFYELKLPDGDPDVQLSDLFKPV
jgi:hypothetical protein